MNMTSEEGIAIYKQWLYDYDLKESIKKDDPMKVRFVSFFGSTYWIDLEGEAWKIAA